MSNPLEGGCGCGQVRYRLMSAPMFVNCCHCTNCQRQTGSAFVINALIETDRIELLSGVLDPVAMPTESGRPHDVFRCSKCKTALWSNYGTRPSLRFLRVGTLDHAAQILPDAHIFVRSKLPWVVLPDAAPAFDVYYDMTKQWTPESLARRRAILGDG